jgi:preprotein translocase subunit Sec61beta
MGTAHAIITVVTIGLIVAVLVFMAKFFELL